MLKKILMIVFIFVLFYLILSPSVFANDIQSNANSGSSGFRTIFAAHPVLNLEYTKVEEDIIPLSGAVDIPLNTSFRLVGRFATLQARRSRGMTINIELSIEEKPSWCEVYLPNPSVQLSLKSKEPFPSTLSVSVTEEAPAFTECVIKVKAKSNEISGIFFTRVTEAEAIFDISFIVGYWPAIGINLVDGNYKEIPADTFSKIRFELENIGNGPTYVSIEVLDKPKNWAINYPKSVVLGSSANGRENTEQFYLIVRPPRDFSRETIKLLIDHSYLGRPSLKGQPNIVHIILKNDGSLTEGKLDLTLLIITFIIVILLIPASIFIRLRSYKKKV